MKKIHLILILVLVFAIMPATQVAAARPAGSIALGVQGGFLATGIVADINLGFLAINAGVNYPLGYTYIASLAGAEGEDLFLPLFTVTADVTSPMPLGDNFYLKPGVSAIAFTDFESGIGGVAGACLKAEYWIPNQNYGLFVNMNVPVMLFGAVANDLDETSGGIYFSPWLPLFGLLTTTAGALWSF